jgi:HAD superfamily hydrolase (TIGR01509 family)
VRPAAVLWDMDGLLVDAEPLWTRAEQEIAARVGGEFTPAVKAAIVGTRLEVAVPTMLQAMGAPCAPADVDQGMAWLLARMVELFAGPLPLQPGAAGLLAALHQAGVPCALVSSSYRSLVDAVLAHGHGPFALTVAGDEVGQGKPHPEPYLTAAARLGVDPADCVVLEDSPAGVASGLAAGCAVVAVPSLVDVPLPAAARLRIVSTLSDVDVSTLGRVVAERAA